MPSWEVKSVKAAAKVVYISSTGVYGGHEGIIDHLTPVDEAAEGAGGKEIAARNTLVA
ncbi:MAG: hypothetical protein R3D26_02745 [Cyanobacteriota/Melainabacteria group bacterium]